MKSTKSYDNWMKQDAGKKKHFAGEDSLEVTPSVKEAKAGKLNCYIEKFRIL